MDSTQKWDAQASNYQSTYDKGENDYNGLLMHFLATECGLAPGSRVIDIGCGVGKYGVNFARMGCDVTLTDISPKMLEFAEKNLAGTEGKWHTLCGDWRDIPLENPALTPKFDVSLSTMSPAVTDTETVAKMSSVTDGWCLLTQFYRWESPLRTEFCRRLDLPEKPVFSDLEGMCGGIIQSVATAGYTPLVTYRDYNWCDVRTPEESAERFLSRYFEDEQNEAVKEAALQAARAMADDRGEIRDAVNTKVAWIYWATRQG